MSDFETAFKAVTSVTGISKTKMLSRIRTWPVVEARMLYILLLSTLDYPDSVAASILGRRRTTILHLRHNAYAYSNHSSIFRDKEQRTLTLYERFRSKGQK